MGDVNGEWASRMKYLVAGLVIALAFASIIGGFMILARITDIVDKRVINQPWFYNFIIGLCILGVVLTGIVYLLLR
jgi:hypothetical protein